MTKPASLKPRWPDDAPTVRSRSLRQQRIRDDGDDALQEHRPRAVSAPSRARIVIISTAVGLLAAREKKGGQKGSGNFGIGDTALNQ